MIMAPERPRCHVGQFKLSREPLNGAVNLMSFQESAEVASRHALRASSQSSHTVVLASCCGYLLVSESSACTACAFLVAGPQHQHQPHPIHPSNTISRTAYRTHHHDKKSSPVAQDRLQRRSILRPVTTAPAPPRVLNPLTRTHDSIALAPAKGRPRMEQRSCRRAQKQT
jgi:hypothetical protein